MATPADRDNLDNIGKINAAAKTLADTYKQIENSVGRLNADQQETLDIAKSLASASSDIEKSINLRISGEAKSRDIAKQIKALTQNQLNQNGELNKLEDNARKANLAKRITQQQLIRATREQIVAEEALGQKASITADYQSKIRDYELAILQAQGRRDRSEVSRLTNLKNQASLTLDSAKQAEKDAKEDLRNKDKALSSATKLTEEAKKQAKIAIDARIAYEAAIEAQKKELELLNKAKIVAQGKEVLNVLAEKFNVKQIKDMFTLVGIFKMILESALNYNKISVEIGKNFGYGADQANRVASNLVSIAQHSDNVNVTLKNAAEAMSQLNEQTGFVAEYSADALETQIMLTKQFGLTADEAAGIYKLSVLNGKSSEQINKSMVGAFVATRNQLGVGIPFKATMAEAAKVSGQLAANLKNNPEFIVKAVAQAKALGTTLEQTKKQGESLLDFESSIESELKAELLTGQAINLERARAAALMGDQVTVMKELTDQGMTLEKFQNMNVLAQKSFAAAIGLSSDELANQLTKQKLAVESGKSLAQLTEEEAIEAEKRQNIQDKFNAAIEKLQDLIGNLVAGPVGKLLEAITSILSNTTALWAILGGLGGYMIASIIPAFSKLGAIMKVIRMQGIGAAIVSVIKGAWESVGTIPFIGPVLAGAAIAGGIALVNSYKADDLMSEPGYGERTLTTKEGKFNLNNRDTILAGTDLFGGKTPPQQPTQDNSGMVAAINSLHQTLSQKNFSPVLKADSTILATTTAQGSYNLA
jgi:hypothetical protein